MPGDVEIEDLSRSLQFKLFYQHSGEADIGTLHSSQLIKFSLQNNISFKLALISFACVFSAIPTSQVTEDQRGGTGECNPYRMHIQGK